MTIRQPSSLMRQRWWVGLIVLVLLTGFGIRVWDLNTESIWHDEGWSIRAIHSPFGTPDDNTPYVYYTVGHLLWKTGIGNSAFAYRYLSVLIGLLTVALAVRVGRRWYGTWAGIVTGILVATSPLMWEYSQEVRAYVAVPLLALALLALADRLYHQTRRGEFYPVWWLLMFGVELVGIYTHNLMVPVIVWLNVALAAAWIWQSDWQNIVRWGFSQAVLVVAYLPWLSTQSPSGTPLNSPPSLDWPLVVDIWRAYFLPVVQQVQAADGTLLIDLLGVALIGLLVALIVFERTARTWLLVSHVLLVPYFSAVLIIVANIDYHPRYFVAAVPVTLLTMVAGLMAMQKQTGLRPVQVGMAILVVVGLLISRNSLNEIADTPAYQHDDFRSLAEYYATLPDDAIIVVPYDREPALQDFYADDLDIKARFANIPTHSDEATALRYLRRLAAPGEQRHVEFLTWHQLPADIRGMYPCILTASVNQDIEPRRDFRGALTQRYDVTQPSTFEELPARPAYDELLLHRIGVMSSTQGACVRSEWELMEEIDENLQLSVSVYSRDGDTRLAQADREITSPDQVPTSLWDLHNTGSAYNLVRLPAGTAPDDYQVQLRVYSESQPNGLELTGESVGVERTIYALPETVRLSGPAYPNAPDRPIVLEDNVPEDGVLDGSQPLQVTLLLNGLEPNAFERVNVNLRDVNGTWQISNSALFQGDPVLSWHTFNIPSDVVGMAELVVADQVVETYTIRQPERLFTAPDFDLEVNEKFPGVGNLIGASMERTELEFGEPFSVSLVWQVNTATDISYTVFVQLLDRDGRLIAQSDSIPVGGARPTTQWMPGEYLIDNHTLNFRVDEIQSYEGEAMLIVGLYDAATGNRVSNGEGEDHGTIPYDITVINQ